MSAGTSVTVLLTCPDLGFLGNFGMGLSLSDAVSALPRSLSVLASLLFTRAGTT